MVIFIHVLFIGLSKKRIIDLILRFCHSYYPLFLKILAIQCNLTKQVVWTPFSMFLTFITQCTCWDAGIFYVNLYFFIAYFAYISLRLNFQAGWTWSIFSQETVFYLIEKHFSFRSSNQLRRNFWLDISLFIRKTYLFSWCYFSSIIALKDFFSCFFLDVLLR